MRAALILDFDGTIAPTEHVVFETWRRFFAPHGYELTLDMYAKSIGRAAWTDAFDPWAQAEQMGLGNRDTVRPAMRAIQADLLAAMRPNPGVSELIAAAVAHGLPLGCASSSEAEWVTRHLTHFGWREHFASIRTREHGPGKPSPRLFELAVEDLGADAACSWAIEDSGPGVTAAKAAGLQVVAVPHELTASHDVSAADLVVSSLAEITLARLGLAPDV